MSPYLPPTITEARLLASQLRSLVDGFEAATLLGHEAIAAVEVFATIKDVAAHAELLAAGAVAERHAWQSSGEPSAAHWLSRSSGVGLSEARDVLSTARRLDEQPTIDAAARAGSLSCTECIAIADAAAVNADATADLLGAVGTESTSELRERCLNAKAAARDPEEHHRALHEQRALRTRTDGEGAFRLNWKSTPAVGAEFMAALTPFIEEQYQMARAAGRNERAEALAADALAVMAASTLAGHAPAGVESDPPTDAQPSLLDDEPTDARTDARPTPPKRRPPSKVIVRVDLPALLRGHPVDGEVCEIPGFGPVPVSLVHQWLPESLLAVVFTKGVDVVNVTHLSRKATVHQQTALEWIQPRCAAKGCARQARLQIDHREDWHRTHHTRLDELDHLCFHHHDLKSHHNWQLVAGRGRRPMVPPDHPDHPQRAGRRGNASGADDPDMTGTAA